MKNNKGLEAAIAAKQAELADLQDLLATVQHATNVADTTPAKPSAAERRAARERKEQEKEEAKEVIKTMAQAIVARQGFRATPQKLAEEKAYKAAYAAAAAADAAELARQAIDINELVGRCDILNQEDADLVIARVAKQAAQARAVAADLKKTNIESAAAILFSGLVKYSPTNELLAQVFQSTFGWYGTVGAALASQVYQGARISQFVERGYVKSASMSVAAVATTAAALYELFSPDLTPKIALAASISGAILGCVGRELYVNTPYMFG